MQQGTRSGDDLLREEPRLARMVELARERLVAREVWLFGSRARGDHRPDSDWNLLVLVPDDAPEEALDVVALWRCARDAGLIAIVTGDRACDFAVAREAPGMGAYEIAREGIRLA